MDTASVAKRSGRANKGSKPGERRGGRAPGTPNKVTQDFRETITRLLEDNRENFAIWLRQVAEGCPPVLDATGKVIQPGRPPDPGAAISKAAALADFAAPRLSRSEVTGEAGGPLNVIIHKTSG